MSVPGSAGPRQPVPFAPAAAASMTATLVLTDVEGSTRLWSNRPDVMPAVMARHHEIVHSAIEAHGGWRPVDQGEGDAVFAAFDTPGAAVAAVAELQRDLAAEPWTRGVDVAVRVGVHTGEVLIRDGNLFGPTVNRCSRLRGLAAGGQTLLSTATWELVRDSLPAGLSVRDLGEHRMKDLTRPEHVHQLEVAGLRTEFPPLAGLGRARHNLPVQTSSFLGREAELAELVSLVGTERLVTVVGFGGMGKTRLALQVAVELAAGELGEIDDGVWFVDLSAERDPTRVASAINAVLGINEGADRPLGALLAYLRDRRLLLVLDNVEQLLPVAAATVDAILRAGVGTRVLATSREPLRLSGEQQYELTPLPVPPQKAAIPLSEAEVGRLSTYTSVLLFITRAAATCRGFALTPANASAIAGICVRLDGHPLALELAAARIRMMSPEALLPRLDGALTLLTGGSRDSPTRQQTLRATIAWSYDLLDPEHKRLLDRLSIFPATFTLSAAESICGPAIDAEPGLDVVDGLSVLVDRNLVRSHFSTGHQADNRHDLLVSIREYAGERLRTTGLGSALADRHAAYYAEASSYPPDYSADDVDRIDRFRVDELHNIRAALDDSRTAGTAAREARLAANAGEAFWALGLETELSAVADHALRRGGKPSHQRVELLGLVRAQASRAGRFDEARRRSALAVREARELGDQSVLVRALGQALAGVQSRVEYEAVVMEGQDCLAGLPTTGLQLPRWRAEYLWDLGTAENPWSTLTESEAALRRILSSSVGSGARAYALMSLSWLLGRQDRHQDAVPLLTSFETETGHADAPPVLQAVGTLVATETRIALGDVEAARADLELAKRRLHGIDRPDLWRALGCHEAAIDRLSGDHRAAERRLRRLIATGEFAPLDQAWVTRLLAVVRREQGDPAEATALIGQAWAAALRHCGAEIDLLLLCLLERAQQVRATDPAEAVRLIGLVTTRRPEGGFEDSLVSYDTTAMLAELRTRLGDPAVADILTMAASQPLPDLPDWTTSEDASDTN